MVKLIGWAFVGFAPITALIGWNEGQWWWLSGVLQAGLGAAIIRTADPVADGLAEPRSRARPPVPYGWLSPGASKRINIASWIAVAIELIAVISVFVRAFDMPRAGWEPIFRSLFFPASLLTTDPGDAIIVLLGLNVAFLTVVYVIVIELPLALVKRWASAR
jgi:hypothetical protein